MITVWARKKTTGPVWELTKFEVIALVGTREAAWAVVRFMRGYDCLLGGPKR